MVHDKNNPPTPLSPSPPSTLKRGTKLTIVNIEGVCDNGREKAAVKTNARFAKRIRKIRSARREVAQKGMEKGRNRRPETRREKRDPDPNPSAATTTTTTIAIITIIIIDDKCETCIDENGNNNEGRV